MAKLIRILQFAIFILFVFFSTNKALATHNRAGEISVAMVGDCVESLTVRATITTWTKTSAVSADRDSLTIVWGDGSFDVLIRENGGGNPPQGEPLENDIKFNIYIGVHTYPARGTYTISMTDPNRNGGVINVNYPYSDQVRFHLQTTYTFPNPQFQGCNNTPILVQPPIDIGCVGQVFTHNPNAFDEDGDSLSYHFIVPMQDVDLEVPNYQYPNQIAPGPDNNLTINEKTGDIVWDAPQRAGEYNLAMIIVEYRYGIPIDTIIRDMQILIEECDNMPPEVETPFDEICVIAGDILQFEVSATAPLIESSQKVRLTALGGPFEVTYNQATFTPDNSSFLNDPVTKTFTWHTSCNHISDQYYSLVFKATDNYFGDTTGLATLKTVRIKVVGPPPEDLTGTSTSDFLALSWEKPYFCDDAADDYFRGFTVWRREDSNNFPIDICVPGLEGRGYTKLTNVAFKEEQDGRYFYADETAEQGRTYCYRVLAEFAKTTSGGDYTYNTVESLPSAEFCLQLNRDIPLLTHADVLSTDAVAGEIRVCWSKPKVDDLDTLQNYGPYRYELLRAPGITTNEADFLNTGIFFDSDSFANANDTCYTDTGLNTLGTAYSYRLNFYVKGGELLGTTNPASSVFLNISPTDNANVLSWDFMVPWVNTEYTIYRQNDLGTFDSIAVTTALTYTDPGLTNGKTYCYKIRSRGSYGVDDVINPILNFSQENCGEPIDNVPPCPPTLEVKSVCDEAVSCVDEDNLTNTLIWVNPMDICEETDDVVGYNIYFADFEGSEFKLVAHIDDAETLSFEHNPEQGISGCYAVTALDTFSNESIFSNIVCVDNCPFYELPNTFTPNDDGQNDRFIPRTFCFIESIDFKVFNRWGQLVFQTTDPQINWDGNNLKNKELADGVYYYTCQVFERRVGGITPRRDVLTGYIELIRGRR